MTRDLEGLLNMNLPFKDSLEYAESYLRTVYLQEVLKHHGSVSAAARHAKMDRTNFRRLLKKYNVPLPSTQKAKS